MGDMILDIPNDTSKGLSHAIDAKLDAEFQAKYGIEDVDLSGHWQSIFDKIKANQAEQAEGQRTFGEKDKDVKKGSQYKVNAGKYVIKESVWNYIVNKAKEVTGVKDTPQTEAPEVLQSQATDTPPETPETDAPDGNKTFNASGVPASSGIEAAEDGNKPAETVESKVSKILSDAKIDTSGINMDLVNQKYEELINTKDKDGNPLDEAIINQKIKNFAILQRKENFETAEKRFTEMAKKYPTEDDFKKGDAKSLVNDYISQLDDENSKYVDADITAAMEAGDMDKYKAALHKFGKARLGEYDKNNDGTISRKEFKSRERGTGDTKIKRNDLNKRFDYLDVNGDGKLDEKEMTAYYYAMTKCTDGENEKTGNDITYREYMTAQQALASAGSKSITANEKLIYDKFTSWRKEGYDNL